MDPLPRPMITTDIDPETYVEENRQKLLAVVRHSDDPFIRACAWALLDRYTPATDVDQLHDELDAVMQRRAES